MKVGNNIKFDCDYNFNYLLEQRDTQTHQDYVYELFLQGGNNDYYQVAIYLDGADKPTRRFFLQDTFTSDTSLKVVTKMNFKIYMNTTGFLVTPQLHLTYTDLTVQNGLVTPDSDKTQTISY